MTHLQVKNLAVELGRRTIVDSVSFAVETGQWLCIIGPNGAGKSSILKSIVGLIPSSGLVQCDDINVLKLSERDRACWISYVAQSPIFPAGMTVREYVLLGRTAHLNLLVSETKHDQDIADLVIADIGLSDLADRDIASLSGGERQRAAIARALTQTSPVMILDEPTTGLDLGYEQEVLQLLNRLRIEKQLTIVTTMHNLNSAAAYPDTLLMLVDGTPVARGTAAEVLTSERIAQHYHAQVDVKILNGKPVILPNA